MDMGIVRSSWAKNAVWGSFKGGPYVACPCSGEEYPDKGNVAIVNGARPFLVNTGGALQRNTPGADDGGQYFDPIYNELFGDTGNREIFNLFYVSEPKPAGQGEYLRNDGARTSMVAFDDGGDYVFMSSSHLEDEYPQRRDSNPQTIMSWTRDAIYVRPDIFVVDDATEISDPSIDQWLAWHFATRPIASGSTGTRYDIGSGSAYAGTIESVFPTGSKTKVVNVFDSDKVYRVEIRPGASGAGQRWLTVFDAASSPSDALDATAMSSAAGNITAGAATGVLLVGTGRNVVYVKVDQPGSGVTYRAPVGSTLNVVSGLDPLGSYSVVVSSGSGATTVSITPSGNRHPSDAGVLSFST
jgi:hypothetical protein